jgi:hypothetical protein
MLKITSLTIGTFLNSFVWSTAWWLEVLSAIKPPDDIVPRWMHLNPYGNSDPTPDVLPLKGWVTSLLAGSTQNEMRHGG